MAGLNASYAEKKIAEFQAASSPPVDELLSWMVKTASTKNVSAKPNRTTTEARINMVGVAHAINVEEAKASADWYAVQEPGPGRSRSPAMIAEGKELFRKGLPAEGMVTCQTCHGAHGEGRATNPRLAGQNATYLFNELERFRGGDRQHAPDMTTVVRHGSAEQFHALAAYLQSQ